jgi:hypothetical protein
MNATDIEWTGPPAPDDAPWIPLYRAVSRGSFELTVLSCRVLGVITHWVSGRSVPCTKLSGECICLRGGVSHRWRGYLGCWESRFSRVCLLEMTAEAVHHCNLPILDPAVDLRGMVARAWRLGSAKQAPVRIELRGGPAAREDLPPAPNVERALLRLWTGH